MDIDSLITEKALSEPQLVILGHGEGTQGFTVSEKQILLEVDEFNIPEGLITLICTLLFFFYNQ